MFLDRSDADYIQHVTRAVCTYKNSRRAAVARLKRIEVSKVRFRGGERGDTRRGEEEVEEGRSRGLYPS